MSATLSTPVAILSTDSLAYRRAARQAAGVPSYVPVELVDGAEAPHATGTGSYYTTPGGTVIAHPSAYRRAGGWQQVYHRSTYRVVVGRDWRPAQQ
ncbi:MAG: hypothetical protein ACE15D_18610 [Candidatus Eisenbacteria bacterium]